MSTSDPPDSPESWQPPPPPPPPPAPPPYGQQPPAYGQQPPPYGQQPPAYGYAYNYYPVAPQQEGTAVGALIAAILSWLVCPVIPAIIALALVSSAQRKINESNGRLTGESLLTATRWIAWLNIGLMGALFAVIILLIVIGAIASSGSSGDFQRLSALLV